MILQQKNWVNAEQICPYAKLMPNECIGVGISMHIFFMDIPLPAQSARKEFHRRLSQRK